MKENVVIVGASNKPERYSYRAFQMLKSAGHTPIPVHPVLPDIDGVPVVPALKEVHAKIDTVTMYVGPNLSTPMLSDLIALHPKRIVFNPGSENPAIAGLLQQAGIEVIEACTLVMLSTHQF